MQLLVTLFPSIVALALAVLVGFLYYEATTPRPREWPPDRRSNADRK